MRISKTIQLSFRSLTSHPFRSFLACLGVVFGVGSVVGMLAIGEGARVQSLRQIEEMGVDKIIIESVPPKKSDIPEGYHSLNFGVTDQDMQYFNTNFENIRGIMAMTSWNYLVISDHVRRPRTGVLGRRTWSLITR